MKRVLLLLLVLFTSEAAWAQPASLPELDRVRLAEAFQLADEVQGSLWQEWSEVPFVVLLVTPEHEFLVRHPQPSSDFRIVSEYDSLLQSAVYVRERQFSPNLLATFPAVSGLPTVVVGQAEQTGKTSTFWVLTLLHEHFHQLQYSQPNYYDNVAALDLAGGDESGMWMLNYPFPYESAAVVEAIAAYQNALRRALSSLHTPQEDQHLEVFRAALDRLQDVVEARDYRYLSFQLWQEGIARYTEMRVAEAAAATREPMESFKALDDFVAYADAADSLQRELLAELASFDLKSSKRVAFYALGAAGGLLLDTVRPGWRRHYFDQMFELNGYFEAPSRDGSFR